LQNIETLHANNMGIKFFSKWAGYYTKVVNTLQEVGKKDIVLAVMSPFLNSLTTLTLFGIGIWRILNGSLTIGMFVALQMLLRYLMNPVMQLVGFSQSIQLLKVDASRLNDLLSQPVDPLFLKKVEPQETDTKLKGHAEMRGIVFGYNFLDAPILENINLEISPGKSVALIGPTGCGKSTVAKLLAGLFHSWKGEILFDGKASEQIPLKIIVNSLSLVEQEPFIFNGTVKENLTMLDPEIDMEDIIKAAKDARIHNEILARQGGYDHVLEENGANLSQGQRQRLEIARGLIKNPSMLILDEATSALDSGMEEEIIKNIRRRGCAVLIIAHRLSTIRSCDEILIMEKGKIVEKGTHDELKQKSKIYQEFIEA
jgi:ATP-binding cassette, subfamily C, bacterial